MPIDLSKLRETAGKLSTPAPSQTPPPDERGARERRDLQQARGALNAEAFPPGQEPEGDPVDEALVAGRSAGGRGSDQAMEAYASHIFAAAQAGDPRAMSQGTVDSETRERWMADAHKRQVANRDQGGMIHR
jgi:hypothetical protein